MTILFYSLIFCFTSILIFCGYLVTFIIKKQTELKKIQDNHHSFLLKVKNDLPLIYQRVVELEEQITPPDQHKLH